MIEMVERIRASVDDEDEVVVVMAREVVDVAVRKMTICQGVEV